MKHIILDNLPPFSVKASGWKFGFLYYMEDLTLFDFDMIVSVHLEHIRPPPTVD